MQANGTQGTAALNVSAAALSRNTLGQLLRLEALAALAMAIRLGGMVQDWRQRAADRASLARMSARDWSDIGLSRGDVLHEVEKPFWRV